MNSETMLRYPGTWSVEECCLSFVLPSSTNKRSQKEEIQKGKREERDTSDDRDLIE